MKLWPIIVSATFLAACSSADSPSPTAGLGDAGETGDAGQTTDTNDAAKDDAATITDAGRDAGTCAPCTGSYATCIVVGSGEAHVYTESQLSDGACKVGGMTFTCGGAGTGADGKPLTWSLQSTSPTIVVTVGGFLLNCRACPSSMSLQDCNNSWAN